MQVKHESANGNAYPLSLNPLGGNVGIGTATPGQKLEVAGDVNATGTYYYGDSKIMFQYSDTWLRLNPTNAFTDGIYANTGIFRTDGTLQVGSSGSTLSVATGGDLNFKSGVLFGDYSADSIGIGTTTPNYPLDIFKTSAGSETVALNLRNNDGGSNNTGVAIAFTAYNANTVTGKISNVRDASGQYSLRLSNWDGTSNAEHMRINYLGNVGIGITAPNAKLDVTGNYGGVGLHVESASTYGASIGGTTAGAFFNSSTSACWTYVAYAGYGGYSNCANGFASDARLKEDVNTIGSSLDIIDQLNPVTFRWKEGSDQAVAHQELQYGFIAQDVQDILPDLVGTVDMSQMEVIDGQNPNSLNRQLGQTLALDYQSFIPIALSGIKELNAKVKGLSLNDSGDVILQGNSKDSYALATPTGTIDRIAAFADLFVARLDAGFIQVRELLANQVTTQTITTENQQELSIIADTQISGDLKIEEGLEVSGQSKLGQLIANEASIAAITVENATVSGTLYAENIEANSISANVITGLQERLTSQIEETLSQPSLLASLFGEHAQQSNEYLDQLNQEINGNNQNSASSSADLAALETGSGDLTLIADDAFINQYLEVNGSAYIANSLKVGQNFMIGNSTTIGDGFVSYQPEIALGNDFTFYIQPTGLGKLSLMADLMQLDSQGFVTINGDLKVAGVLEVEDELRAKGTLLTNLISSNQPGESIKVQLATNTAVSSESAVLVQENNFEFIDENQTPVASFSANGDLALTGSLRLGQSLGVATESGQLVATNQRSAGQALLPAGTTEITISSDKVEENSMIYVTPMNSTNNQVLYVKSKITDSTFTPENEAQFTVGIDYALGQDVVFNWWIVQLN
jgi:hypothetical protein